MTANDTLVPPGIFADRYTIERELGRGGSAFVFLARDQRHGTPVAIKLLRPDVGETIGVERFLREIRISAGLHHPHILPVLDSGDHEGRLYFVLPLAEGGTLRERLAATKQLPIEQAISVARTIGAALDYAAERGVIHRDVKPENILFTSGEACLSDFGIARPLDHSIANWTTTGGVIRGTPAYMSPEQASGEENLGACSDLYSLACVVYEMLSGMQPFIGPTPQSVITQRFNHNPPPIRQFRPTVPELVDEVVRKALAITPADRFQSGAEFTRALEDATRSAVAPVKRRVSWRTFATTAAVAAVAAATAILWPRDKSAEGIPDGDPRRVAVMYLDDLTPETLPRYVADGLTEDLIDQLGDVRALQVITPYGARTMRGDNVGIDSIRRALKVGTIISGSIARAGDSIRVSVRLTEAGTNQQLASIPLVAAWSDLFSLRQDLAAKIAFTLRQRIGDRVALREDRAATRSIDAWTLAQQASTPMQHASEMRMPSLYLEADTLYARSARLDPTWDEPWIKRGRIALGLAILRSSAPPGVDSLAFHKMAFNDQRLLWYRRGFDLADSALARASRSAQALALRGEAGYLTSLVQPAAGDTIVRAAERDLRAALEIRPDAASAWTSLASLLLGQQRYATAAEAAKRGYDADPYFESRRTLSTAFFTALYAEKFDDARRWCQIGLAHYADDPRFIECDLTRLGWTGHTAADLHAAQQMLATIESTPSRDLVRDTWGYRRLMVIAVAARAGMRDSAQKMLSALHASHPADSVMRNTVIGESYVRLLMGDSAASLSLLEGYLRQAPQMRASVAANPWFAALRGHARFTAMVAPPK